MLPVINREVNKEEEVVLIFCLNCSEIKATISELNSIISKCDSYTPVAV